VTRNAPVEKGERLALWHEGARGRGYGHWIGALGGRHGWQCGRRDPDYALLHGGEKAVLGDAGYQGVGKRAENADKAIDWHVAMRPSVRKTLKKNSLGRATEKLEKAKASVRAKVEHCFHVVKCLFKHRKTRYRGLAKNNAQLFTLFGFANLVLARRFLGTVQSRCVLRSETDQKFSRNGRFEASKSRFDQKIAARETQSAKGLLSREKVNCSALP
jgi:hypothetical protein